MAHHVEVQQLLMRADNIMLCAQAGAGRSQSTQENVQTYGVIVIAFYRGHSGGQKRLLLKVPLTVFTPSELVY